MDAKFGRGIDLDKVSDKFEGQGHRSKVKVAIKKNVIFRRFYGVTCVDWTEPVCYDIRCHAVTSRDVMTSHRDVT